MMIRILNQATTENYEKQLTKVLKKAYKITRTSKQKPIQVILVENQKIKQLNKDYRDKDELTDVLTFPSDHPDELGDVFIALHVAQSQAKDYGHPFERELAFLTIHGFLHSIGYDHQTEAEEKTMFELQNTILDALKLYR